MKTLIFTSVFLLAVSCGHKCDEAQCSNHQASPHKELIETYFKHFNNHDWAKMAAMYKDTADMKDPAYGPQAVKMTPSEIAKKYSELHQLFPDVRDSIINTYHAGDKVIVEFISSGMAPDSTKFSLPICTIFEFQNGKISKDYTYYDNFEEESDK